MKSGVFSNTIHAKSAVHRKEVNIAIVQSGNTGRTSFYLLHDKKVPKKLQELPGFRNTGIIGIHGVPIESYECYRTTDEVSAAIDIDRKTSKWSCGHNKEHPEDELCRRCGIGGSL